MFTESCVAGAVDLLKEFAESRHLGAPVKVLFRDEMLTTGIGCEWAGGIRNAVVIKGETRNDDAKEVARRLNEWAAA